MQVKAKREQFAKKMPWKHIKRDMRKEEGEVHNAFNNNFN